MADAPPPESPPKSSPPDVPPQPLLSHHNHAIRDAVGRYWRKNLSVMAVLLAIWAAAGLGCGVLFADVLNDMGSLGGYPLGFWFAQQGSIIVFVVLILVYALVLNKLDRDHVAELRRLTRDAGDHR